MLMTAICKEKSKGSIKIQQDCDFVFMKQFIKEEVIIGSYIIQLHCLFLLCQWK